MTDKEKIRAEIERLKKCSESAKMEWIPAGYNQNAFAEDCRIASFNKLLSFIDSIQEEPKLSNVEQNGKNRKEEPLSEDLEESAKLHVIETRGEDIVWDENARCAMLDFKAGAQWKEKEMQSTIELAEDHAMFAGMEKMKEEMMKNATEAVVAIDSGGYPYIDKTIELYDYDKDEPLAKEGDKYKVILIKEEE